MKSESLLVEKLVVGQMQENCYLISDVLSHDCIIVDPGDDSEYITDALLSRELHPTLVLATHGHFDHILGVFTLSNTFNIPFRMNESDAFLLSTMTKSAQHFLKRKVIDPEPIVQSTITSADTIHIGSDTISVLETPGHTPGSVCYLSHRNRWIVSGDVLFSGGGVGRSDHQYSNKKLLTQSVLSILSLPEVFTIYPGHGDNTTVKAEKIFWNTM